MKQPAERIKIQMSNSRNTIRSCVLTGVAFFLGTAAHAADLEVSVEGLRSDEGEARIALYKRVPDLPFPDEGGAIAGLVSPADPGGVSVIFTDLEAGEYAIAAFHDSNGNGELDLNILNIPVEGYGFSNGAVGFMGPPSFDDAAFTIGSDEERLSVVVPVAYPGS